MRLCRPIGTTPRTLCMTMLGIRPYDVWLMWVEYPDCPGISKPRPVVATGVDDDAISGIIVKISSNGN